MASIIKDKGRWRAFVFKHGIRRSKTFDTKREAQAWALRQEAELDGLALGAGRTFAALAQAYLKRVTPTKRSQRWESNTIARLREQIGDDTPLASIDSVRIGLWRDDRLLTVSGSTVQREANLLRNMLKVASEEWKWYVGDAFLGVRLPRHNPARTAIWPWQLIRRVLRAERRGKTAQMQRAFLISLHTGMRLQEVLQHEYDAERGVIVLRESKTGAAEIPVTRRARRHLPTEPFTVGSKEGSALFSKLIDQLLIDGLTFHDARATALMLMSRRMDILTLSRISRHRDLRILSNTYYREKPDAISRRI